MFCAARSPCSACACTGSSNPLRAAGPRARAAFMRPLSFVPAFPLAPLRRARLSHPGNFPARAMTAIIVLSLFGFLLWLMLPYAEFCDRI